VTDNFDVSPSISDTEVGVDVRSKQMHFSFVVATGAANNVDVSPSISNTKVGVDVRSKSFESNALYIGLAETLYVGKIRVPASFCHVEPI
jgi:hypothetical protein